MVFASQEPFLEVGMRVDLAEGYENDEVYIRLGFCVRHFDDIGHDAL